MYPSTRHRDGHTQDMVREQINYLTVLHRIRFWMKMVRFGLWSVWGIMGNGMKRELGATQ